MFYSDPATRSKYDAKGLEALSERDLTNVEIDLSSLNTVNSVFAAMFSRLGVLSVKTMVAPSVIANAESGDAELRPLSFGRPVTDRVDKNCAHYYNFTVTEGDIDKGFCVWVKSPSSRFKVLMFEKQENETLEIRIQEDSSKEMKQHVAGIFFFSFSTYNLGPPPSALQCADDPESTLFRRLDTLERRQSCSLHPGEYVFAVYGDNFLKASTYTIEVLHEKDFVQVTERIRALETSLLRKKEEVAAFESSYRHAKKNYEKAVLRFEEELKGMQGILAEREREYAKLCGQQTATAVGSGGGAGGAAGGGLDGAEGGGSTGQEGTVMQGFRKMFGFRK